MERGLILRVSPTGPSVSTAHVPHTQAPDRCVKCLLRERIGASQFSKTRHEDKCVVGCRKGCQLLFKQEKALKVNRKHTQTQLRYCLW